MNRTKDPEWVQQQHRIMLKWLNSKLETNLVDLSQDLGDGLILIQLINKIISEMDMTKGQKLYLLSPLYPKPKFNLQKLENINDFLEFIRIVLKINVTSISADNIVEGNLKLILGLIWSLFIFSTTSSIGVLNDNNSIIEIKQILVNWVNKISKLHQITNFNRDWSIEVNHPDIILETILKYYLPLNYLKVNLTLGSSRLTNLNKILQFAEIIGITSLADLEDFQHLVPDEKSILFYIIEWFKFFEMSSKFGSKNPNKVLQFEDQKQDQEEHVSGGEENLDQVILRINDVINSKFEYETKSLRFSNKIIQAHTKYENILKFMTESIVFEILHKCDIGFKDFRTTDFNDLLVNLQKEIKMLVENLGSFEEMNNVVYKLNHNEMKQLEQIHDNVFGNLKLIDDNLTFQISKSLVLTTLTDKLDEVLKVQVIYTKKIEAYISKLLEHKVLKNIHEYLETVEKFLTKNPNEKLDQLLEGFEILIGFIHKLDYFLRTFKIPKSPSNLKCTGSFNKNQNSESINNEYKKFKTKLLDFDEQLIMNENEFKVILEDMTTQELPYSCIKTLISFVPIKFVTLSSNDSDFSLAYDEEEEDDTIDSSKLIFEGNRRKVGSQLSGNKDKVFDLESFFQKFEGGLKL